MSAGDKAACSTYNTGMTETHEVMDKIVSGKKLVPFLTVTIVARSADSVRSAASVASGDLADAMEQTADSLVLYSEGIEAGDVTVSHPAVVEADDVVSEMCEVS